ncbi:MAG TPA: peptidoglycan-binding protein [Devosia sp.]|nr:peptidoglycan-binding protein [Devosia sp.]
MDPVTRTDLQRFAPHALDGYLDALVAGWDLHIKGCGINTPLRWCHFLAQIAHESGGLRITRENTRWTPTQMKALWPTRFPLGAADPRIIKARGDEQALANLAYSARADIGNEGGDDGWDYRGGGLIQLTGRDCYRECGEAIGVPLEAQPGLIERPEVSLSAAVWEWGRHDNNEFADHNYGRTIGNAINRGNPWSSQDPIGYQGRQQWLARALAVWLPDDVFLQSDHDLYLGAWGPKVESVQRRLKELGYAVGSIDAVLGPATARALAGFKLDRRRQGVDLEPEERVGALTLAALESSEPAAISPERRDATARTLAAAGSTEVVTGQRSQALGRAAVITGATAAAGDVGLLDTVKDALGSLPALQTVVAPVIAAVQWGLKNALWVAVLVGGVWMWVKGKDVVLARLKAHQTGANLGR